MKIRRYEPYDLAAVVAIFRSNIPKYFTPEEEPGLYDFINDRLEDYYVVEVGEEVVGAGGIALNADIDPQKLGFAITVFAMVSLKSQAESDLRAFEDHVSTLPQVRECHMLNGEIDFILKIVARDLQEFQAFLTSRLTPAANVASVKTSLTIRTSKQQPGVPLDE